MKQKILFAWSGGKDSALALAEVLRDDRFEVVALLTTVTRDYDRISMHGVRNELLEQQAKSIGLPLEKVFISAKSSNEEYAEAMRQVMLKYKAQRVSAVAFGDIFLEDVRRYREESLAQLEIEAIFPLWGRDSKDLAQEFISRGFKAIVSCADSEAGCGAFAGREYDEELLAELPSGADPCFENGECHSFVYDGPIFQWPIRFVKGDVVLRDERYFYCDLLPDPAAYILGSERLLFRLLVPDDLDNLYALLSDPEVMKYYPSVLDKDKSREWLDGILADYQKNGFGWWAVHLKETGEFIAQAGIALREFDGKPAYFLSYMFNKRFWGRGYATEAARTLIHYALSELGADRVDLLIRPVNTPSQRVAKRLGLKHKCRIDYKGYEHDIYVAEKQP